MTITIRGLQMQLLAQKAIYLPQQEILVIADMHLGKLVHFRKNGIAVPTQIENEDLMILRSLITNYNPKEVVFLGDLFHSEVNSEYSTFLKTIAFFPTVKFTLTKGNHDIIPEVLFHDTAIEITDERMIGNNIILRHQMPKTPLEDQFYIIGHLHPGYVIEGRGRQVYRLPSFYQSKNILVLPAFGKHTGLFIPEVLSQDKCYVIMNKEVIQMK